MSLYNMVFGIHDEAPLLLTILELKPKDVPRIRDCFFSANEDNIIVYTRTGGGNREYYDAPNEDNKEGPWNSTLRANPYYVRDEDDSYDSTYASFYFRFPEEFAADLKALKAKCDTHTPSENWKELIKRLKGK